MSITVVANDPKEGSVVEKKTKMSFFDVQAWTFRFGIVGFILAILAAGVPQWIYTVPNSVTFGLRATCYGDKCQALNFNLLRSTLNCNAACDDALDQFRLRWRAIEGFSWLGVALLVLHASSLRIGYTREVRPQALGAPHVFFSVVVIMALGTALIIMGASLTCGTGCFQYGASVICKLVAIGLVILAIPAGLIATRLEKYRATFARGTFGMIVLAIAFEIAGLMSNRWIFTTVKGDGRLDAVGIGLFQSCVDNSCSLLNYTSILSPGKALGCNVDSDTLRLRFYIGAGLLIAGGVMSLVFMCVSYKRIEGLARPICVFISAVLITAANALIFHTLEKWMFCDNTYCGIVSRQGTNTACEWGFSAACSIALNIFVGMLFLMEIVESLYQTCGIEETEGESLLRLQQQEAAERKEAELVKQRLAAEEAERQQNIADAAEELRKLVAKREAEDAQREEQERQQREQEELERASAEAALAAAAAAVLIDKAAADAISRTLEEEERKRQAAKQKEDDEAAAISAAAAPSLTKEVSSASGNKETTPKEAAEEGNNKIESDNEPDQEEEEEEDNRKKEEKEQEQKQQEEEKKSEKSETPKSDREDDEERNEHAEDEDKKENPLGDDE